MTGIGYDAANPNIPAELAKHPTLIVAYTDGSYAYSKAEIDQIHAGGSGVLANHERAADALLGGPGAGTVAAQEAIAAVTGWGMPADGSCGIDYSVDVNVPQSKYPIVAARFAEINAVHAGRWMVSFYGQGELGEYLAVRGLIQCKYWLSASKSYPGWNPNAPHCGAVQLVGSDVAGTDKSTVMDAAHMGVWWPPGYVLESSTGTLIGAKPVSMTDAQITADAKAGVQQFDATPEFQGRIVNTLVASGVTGGIQGIAAAVTAIGGRVAQLQAAVAALPTTQAPSVTVDPAVVAAAVTEAVNAALPGVVDAAVAKLTLTLGVKP